MWYTSLGLTAEVEVFWCLGRPKRVTRSTRIAVGNGSGLRAKAMRETVVCF